MLYKSFKIPCGECGQAEQKLNAFLAGHRIICIQKEFCAAECSWCFLIEYAEDTFGKSAATKTDYMQILSKEEFAVFSKLRELRKKFSIEEKIPAYAVFTDEQLFQLVKTNPQSVAQMQKINGIGQSKAQKYGEAFLERLNGKIAASSAAMTDGATQNEADIF